MNLKAPPDGFSSPLVAIDPEIAALIETEVARNQSTVNLIASESYCPLATIEAEASLLVSKNATGYPGSREVAGCEIVDKIERLAISRAMNLFGAEHANVQSVAATLANIAVLRALLKPGDRILSLDETAGGHHSHGAKYHTSGQDYNSAHFGVDETTGGIDIETVRALAKKTRPQIMIVGSTAYPRALPFAKLAEVARETGALFFADIAHVVGLVAAGLHENPVPVSDVVTTSTHKDALRATNRRSRALQAAACNGDRRCDLPRNARRSRRAHHRSACGAVRNSVPPAFSPSDAQRHRQRQGLGRHPSECRR